MKFFLATPKLQNFSKKFKKLNGYILLLVIVFFKKNFEDISPFRGPLIPLFWTSGYISPGFQNQGGSLACFLTCVILRFTSSVTPAGCKEVSMVAEPFQSTYLQMCLQVLVEVQAGPGLKPMTIRAVRSKHSAVNHSATPARPDIHLFVDIMSYHASIAFWLL